ncbi:hypothetical protein CsSME_00043515 [Camellia sinensis var. sinensis]
MSNRKLTSLDTNDRKYFVYEAKTQKFCWLSMLVKMGFKRPFDEEFQEFPLRHPKQVDCGNKLTSFTEIYSCYEPTKKADIPVYYFIMCHT